MGQLCILAVIGGVDMNDQGDTGDGDSHTDTSHKSTIVDVPVTVVSGLDMDLDDRDLSSESDNISIRG
jgi:hypothetical protein